MKQVFRGGLRSCLRARVAGLVAKVRRSTRRFEAELRYLTSSELEVVASAVEVHMKLLLLLLMAAPLAVATPGQVVHQSPFFCDLSKLTPADRVRLQEIAGTLATDRPTVRELPDGYAFEFRGD